MEESRDYLAPLGAFKTRRASTLLSDKLIQKWAEKKDPDHNPLESLRVGGSSKYNMAVPSQVNIDDMQEVLFECINEESLKREAMTGLEPPIKGMRRGSVQVIRPESSSVLEEAKVLTQVINKVVNSRDSEEIKVTDLTEGISKFIPDGVSSVLDLEEDFVEDEDTSASKNLDESLAELTNEKYAEVPKDPVEEVEVQAPVASMVGDAIAELSDSIGGMSQEFTRRLSVAAEARPSLGGTVSDIQNDVRDFIQMLSQKLMEKETEIITDYEKEIKETDEKKRVQLMREKQKMDESLREQRQKKLERKIADLIFSPVEEKPKPDFKPAREKKEKSPKKDKVQPPVSSSQDSDDTDQASTVCKSPTLDVIAEANEPTTMKQKKPKKQRTAEEKAERKARKAEKKAKKEAIEAAKAKKSADAQKSPKRRKTSTGKKLNKLRTDDSIRAMHLPDNTPAPDFSVTPADFLSAASQGKFKVVIKYLHDGGAVNIQDEHKRTALQRAALYGEDEVIDVLITKKAKMNLSDKLGNTALHWACRGGHVEVIKKLVKSGAKINAKDKLFSTPLHVAVRCGIQESVETLIKLGADINAKDREGDTAMHDSVRLGKFKLIKLLLQAGANIKLKNSKKMTAVDMVQLWINDSKNAQADQLMAVLLGKD